MARVENVHPNGDDLFVPALNRVVAHGEVVEIPDAEFESWYPDDDVRADDHPWSVVEEPVYTDELRGDELKQAVADANEKGAEIPSSATADEKRAALAEWQAAQTETSEV